MIVLPAIDLKDGACVRLKKGDFDTVHPVARDAVETARAFEAAGAKYIHMVDLDGAKSGCRINGDLVKSVARETGLKIELGGGIRAMADLEELDQAGVYRMVIGSAAVRDPEFLKAALARYGERIAVGLDAKDGFVRLQGWLEDSGLHYLDAARSMEEIGVKTLIFTDIDTDGMLQGPAYDRLEALLKAVSCRVIASGGVSTLEDICRLRDLGAYGAIIGKAYYAGTIDLSAAVREAGVQD